MDYISPRIYFMRSPSKYNPVNGPFSPMDRVSDAANPIGWEDDLDLLRRRVKFPTIPLSHLDAWKMQSNYRVWRGYAAHGGRGYGPVAWGQRLIS
jgi:hypothetical protein